MWALSTSGGGASYHHGDLRRGLIAAGQDLLRSGGVEAVSFREAARLAGVSHNAPYRHFPSREALLAALATEGFLALHRALDRAAGEARPPDRLTALGRAYLRFAEGDRATFRLMFGGTLDRAAHPDLAEASAAAFGTLRGAVAEREPSASAHRDALRAWALVHGLAHLVADRQIEAAQAEACLV
ncbi:TetR/AcrR family transcriptional regulator [Methylobacterium sp. IF7SW-B2]|jgi:AcrR family transcriptional regulator|nr:TetR/AcrR family transcriptional regulator [Methylobacterium ajmalii]MBK3408537.1 TetR/AcrR family transcriptional regulator [Methylobacterium ajmalii]MBK3422060.1 TetR/AcrR family transcriptional regulator [Methylobacterium ajmalii]SFF46006.1 transcriptional regulator, TetR family [Methylobacterium sp. yr596]